MGSPKQRRTPEDLFVEVLREEGDALSRSEFRLVTAGLTALRGTVLKEAFNSYERKAVYSMIAYVAVMQEVSEETVRSILATAFDVRDVQALLRDRYDAVMDFLFDLKIKDKMN